MGRKGENFTVIIAQEGAEIFRHEFGAKDIIDAHDEISMYWPLKVTGDVEYLINRTSSGWVVTLLNNNGIFKTQQGMAQVDRTAYVNVTMTLLNQSIKTATEWTTDTTLKPTNGTISLRIAPRSLAIVEIE